ncbi:hypothetical protein IMPR6_230061 [Imperialibacter sp. EC-SDR9]|nr:hypothetical protein IMPERIA89_80104 [Imperialibacter sp. 89]CAD5300021.1 hypothetical protein IMPERIA75_90103 [Imperialibacter sp. 75]VVT15412.1 hypothetical protein IMPR6_230061 [Imperialibacter sp. EC-SDR9]
MFYIALFNYPKGLRNCTRQVNYLALIQRKRFIRLAICWGVLALSVAAHAQKTSKIGRFSVDKPIGCAPLTINISELDNFGNISRQYLYGDSTPVTNSTTHTFNTPGTFNIVQVIGLDINPKTDTLEITVNSPEPPQVTVANCRNFSASVKVPASPYDYYRVYYTAVDSVDVLAGNYAVPHDYGVAGSFPVRVKGFYNGGNDGCGETNVMINTRRELTDPILNSMETFQDSTMLISATLNSGISYVLQVSENNGSTFSEIPLVFQGNQILLDQLLPMTNDYCFRLAAYDPCNNEYYYSNTLCQVSLAASFEQYRNLLNWIPPGTAAQSFEIYRNDTLYYQSANAQATQYPDSTLICNTDYCYQIKVNYPVGFAMSQVVCGTSFEKQNLAPITGIYSTYHGDDLFFSWQGTEQAGPNTTYQTMYSFDGSNFSTGATFRSDVSEQVVSNPQFLKNSYSYTIRYSDECDNLSPPGTITRPVFLNSEQQQTNTFHLTWNRYLPLTDGVRQYYVDLWDINMVLLTTFDVWDPTFYELRLTSEYSNAAYVTVRAEGLGVDADFVTTSNRRAIAFHSDLYLPSAFTPNGDGLNEEFGVKGPEVSDFIFRIYNRWGELVFYTTEQPKGWNGVFKGAHAPQGTYRYYVEGTDAGGRLIKKSGNFVLLKN